MHTIEYLQSGSFPIVVAFSGGKDSVAMVLYLLEQGIERDRIHLHHHDVDGRGMNLFDWPCTESYCRVFARTFGLPLYISYRAGGILREIYRNHEPRQDIYYQQYPDGPFHQIPANPHACNTRLKFPAVSANLLTRWCSSTVKIDVLAAVIRRHPAYRRKVFILTGERRLESEVRSRYVEIDRYPSATKERYAILWRPLLDWDEHAVWAIMERWKVQPHPAYMLGWNRCSCQLCIFGSPNIWATIQLISPQKIIAIGDIESFTGFTLYHRQPIADRVRAGRPLGHLSPYWIEQATSGDFTAPMIVADWTLPPGAFTREAAGAI